MDAIKEKVVGNIRAIRETKNYSEEYVAEKMGIGQSTYNRKENGEGDFTLSELIKLADVLEVSVSKIIDMDLAKAITQYNQDSTSGNTNYIEHQTVVSDEGYKAALAQYEKEVEYLKQQNADLLAAITGKK
jgi:transcriptional regulator with XRE-family HTH domain